MSSATTNVSPARATRDRSGSARDRKAEADKTDKDKAEKERVEKERTEKDKVKAEALRAPESEEGSVTSESDDSGAAATPASSKGYAVTSTWLSCMYRR